MAWWDGDAIDYDAPVDDWYQENDGGSWVPGGSGSTGDTYIPDNGNWSQPEVDYTPGVHETNTDTGYTPKVDYSTVMGKTATPVPTASGIEQSLAQMFTNPNALKLAAVLAEGSQNKKKASAMQALAKNPALDPFGSQRPFYQQQAQQAVTNPYDSPIVKAQIEQMQRAQSIKDAAAGRRSNSLMSAPAVQAEMAKIAMQYQNQMANQGGAQFGPSGSLGQILQSGANAGINGYISPAIAGMSDMLQQQRNDDYRQKYLEAITKFRNQ